LEGLAESIQVRNSRVTGLTREPVTMRKHRQGIRTCGSGEKQRNGGEDRQQTAQCWRLS
jgi:hypothetical protein